MHALIDIGLGGAKTGTWHRTRHYHRKIENIGEKSQAVTTQGLDWRWIGAFLILRECPTILALLSSGGHNSFILSPELD